MRSKTEVLCTCGHQKSGMLQKRWGVSPHVLAPFQLRNQIPTQLFQLNALFFFTSLPKLLCGVADSVKQLLCSSQEVVAFQWQGNAWTLCKALPGPPSAREH